MFTGGRCSCGNVFLWKQLAPLVQYSVDGGVHRIAVIQKAFYHKPFFSFTTRKICNFSVNDMIEQYYFTLNIATFPYKFSIIAALKNEEDKQQFSELLKVVSVRASQRNSESDKPVTSLKTMYESWWAKLLSIFAILMFFLLLDIIIFFPETNFPIWQLLTLVILGVP